MNWKLLVSTFSAVFVAEVGDKTQLATMSLAAGGSSRWAVFIGSSLALVLASAIAVLVGGALTRVIPPEWLRRGAGVLFIVMGLVFLLGRGESTPPPGGGSGDPTADQGQGQSPVPPAPTAGKGGPSVTSSEG